MANNLILPFGQNASGTDILTDTQYQSDNQRLIGNQPGIARLELVNKALRSDSVLAAALAQFIADNQATDVHDSLSLTTLVDMFKNALDNAGLDANLLNGQPASFYTNIIGRLGYTPAHVNGSSNVVFNVGNATNPSEAIPLSQAQNQLSRYSYNGIPVTNGARDVGNLPGSGLYALNSTANSTITGAPSGTLTSSNTRFLQVVFGPGETFNGTASGWQLASNYGSNELYFREKGQSASPWYQILTSKNMAGAVQMFAMSSPPTGWLKANGAAVSRTAYSLLYSAIGTTFGAGDGSTTFNVPDLRGEFARAFDDGRGVDSGRTFGSSQADEFRSHTHTYEGAHAISTGAGGNSGGPRQFTSNTGATGGNETRPRNVALLACIKY